VARRLEIELTSSSDGKWTWRAAGARQPKGVVDGSLLPEGASVGDVLKVEADADLEGLTITTVFAPKGPRKESERLELLGSGREEPLVTQVLAGRGKGRGRDGDDRGRSRGRGRDGKGRDGKGRDGKSGARRDQRSRGKGDGPGRGERGGQRREKPKPPSRPKAPRLRPARTHRQAALKALPQLQRSLAEEVLRGGVPGVRQAVDKMNDKAVAEGMPKVKTEPLVALAERLNPLLKSAEWRDRAEAAVAGIDEVDLRDIRSVVVAADNAARDTESRDLADQLREGLTQRVESEHRKWLDELAATIADGRTVRALRLSSRPPKAGSPLPVDMAEKLAAAASEGLTSEVTPDRWGTVLDAVAFSPVRSLVKAQGIPEKPGDELLKIVKKLASRTPEIAKLFGIEPPAPRKRGRGKGKSRPTPPPPPPPPAPEAVKEPAQPPKAEETVTEPAVETVAEPAVETVAEPAVETAVETVAEPAVEAVTESVEPPKVVAELAPPSEPPAIEKATEQPEASDLPPDTPA